MDGKRQPGSLGGPVFDGPAFVARARRVADLSQRDLADAVGLSRATIGRLETGVTPVAVDLLQSILTLAGLRLAVIDQNGVEVDPVPVDVLRDNAGRRFPSHLDVRAPEDQPAYRGANPRPGQWPATGWYHLRRERAALRRRRGLPVDHPTISGERRRKRDERVARAAAAQARLVAEPPPECSCLDECFELACVSDCLCQCEPPRVSAR